MSEVSGMQEVMQVMATDGEAKVVMKMIAKVVMKMIAKPDKQEGVG